MGPSVPSSASGTTDASCIAFSSSVISRSSSSARCNGAAVVALVAMSVSDIPCGTCQGGLERGSLRSVDGVDVDVTPTRGF
jgi:hypothetical protein